MLCASQSIRCIAAYIFTASGPGESTTDLAWDGQATIHELGAMLAHDRALRDEEPDGGGRRGCGAAAARSACARVTFNAAAVAAGNPENSFRRDRLRRTNPRMSMRASSARSIAFPFVPDDPLRLDTDCYEAFNIQVQGLMKRLQVTNGERVVIGVSGGLDSTHALLVAARTFDMLGLPRTNILGFTMPGFATSEGTKSNAWTLMKALGVTGEEIDIKPAAMQMLKDMGHPFAKGEALYDVTFENVQAGLRTDYLFRLANQRKAFVLGTGDLSELALGWSTYGVGDHMSHYNVNGSVAKTLIQYLVRWVMNSKLLDEHASATLRSILETEISPELVPAGAKGRSRARSSASVRMSCRTSISITSTRFGLRPSKIAFLAWHAWRDAGRGEWPPQFPNENKHAYALEDIRKWLEVFLYRFFEISQFKRSALPNGPKVVSGGNLSPRGDGARLPTEMRACGSRNSKGTFPSVRITSPNRGNPMGKDDLRNAKYVIDIGPVPSLPVEGSDMRFPGGAHLLRRPQLRRACEGDGPRSQPRAAVLLHEGSELDRAERLDDRLSRREQGRPPRNRDGGGDRPRAARTFPSRKRSNTSGVTAWAST